MIPSLVDTCRECRAWQPIGHAPSPSVEITLQGDTNVEGDIMFYKNYLVWRHLDRADRWHAGVGIKDKESSTFTEAIDCSWVQIFGPFKFFIVDGEKGFITEDAKRYLQGRGTTVRTRAPGQHARLIERCRAILRRSMHCIEEQCEREGIKVTFKQHLAEAVFSGNALVSHNGATPYNARFGRQPAMPPDLHVLEHDSEGRCMQRVRGIALQRIIGSTAISRVNRAMRSKTTTPGEVFNHQPGELVDFHRPSGNKDTSGLHGPAKVWKSFPERGLVTLKWNKMETICRYLDVRRFMDFTALVY